MSITITAVANPVYSNAANTTIDCTVTTVELGIIPYTAAANDSEPHGQQLWAALQAGTYGVIAPYVAPAPSPPPIPDLATQLAAALINANVIPASAINATTLTAVNTTLQAAGQSTIAISAQGA